MTIQEYPLPFGSFLRHWKGSWCVIAPYSEKYASPVFKGKFGWFWALLWWLTRSWSV